MSKKVIHAYGLELPLVPVPPLPIYKTTAPTATDKDFQIGQPWVRQITADAASYYVFAGLDSSQDAIWNLASPGASDVDTLTADSGGALSPVGGDIVIAGGTNVTTAGAGNTITINLDAAISLVTSVTAPLYTAGAGVDVAIDAPAGQDVLMTLGDNAAANKFSILDSDSVEVFAVDSNGVMTFTGLTVVGALTQTAGVVSISEDNTADAVGIGNGTVARAIDIGSSAAAHTISIGSATGAASLDLAAGTGNFTLEGGTATTYTISGTGANTGLISIGAGTGAQTLNLMTGGTGIKTVNIGTGAIGNVVTIGTVTGAASLDLKAGTGNFTLEGATATTYTISGTGANTGGITISGGTGAQTTNIATGGTGIKTVNIGTGAAANVITLGTVTGAASLDLKAGTGNFTLDGAAATTYTIGAATTTGTISIGGTAQTGIGTLFGGSGIQTINYAASTGVKTLNFGTGAAANVITLGTVTGAASLDLLCGTGNFTLEGDVASTYEISSTGANTGTAKFASGTGARTVEIAGGGTGIKTINIGAAATADVITIGTTTAAGSLTLAAGTGNITMSGTVNAIDAKVVRATGADITFRSSPTTCTAADTAGVATGATGDINLLSFQEGIIMEQFVLGAGQTIIKPTMSNSGLLCSGDLTNTEGFEYNFGAARTLSQYAFSVGTSAAFFFEVSMTLADISGGNPYAIGFRKAEANNATLANYTDYYMMGMFGGTSATNLTLSSELNAGGQTLQDSGTAWTGGDGGTVTMKILVSAAGVVTATIDGGAPATPLAYTFDSTDVVCPFIYVLHGATSPGAVHLVDMSVGSQ